MENIEAMLCAYIEGDLDEAGRAQIEKHLQEHPQHRKLIESLTATRDLMRDLPRAKAPPDVGEWLHGQVERSILLDDSASIPISRAKASRWPQWLGVAAVLLLFAALGAIVMRMVAPTFKSPVSPTASTVQPPAAVAPPAAAPMDELKNPSATANPTAQDREALTSGAAHFELQQRAAAVAATPLDVQAVRRRLMDSGYAANIDGNEPAAPVVLVINSSNRADTAQKITQFLSSQNGISWRTVPDNPVKSQVESAKLNAAADQKDMTAAAAGALAATRPQTQAMMNAAQNDQAQNEYSKTDKNAMQFGNADLATTPATDMYVAQGMTMQQAGELQQSLATQPDVQACQVFKQINLDLPATRPSANTNVAVAEQQLQSAAPGQIAPMSVAGEPTTAPAAPTTAPALADTTNASPTVGPAASIGGMGGGGGSNSRMALSNIDAVIVLQPAGVVSNESTSAPTAPTTEPAASTPPATQP